MNIKRESFVPVFLAAFVLLPGSLAGEKRGSEKAGKKREAKEQKEQKEKAKVKEESILFLLNSNEPAGPGAYITVLGDLAGETFIPIIIGEAEGEAIKRALLRERPPRPLTHDLIASIITDLGGVVESLTIASLVNNTYFGVLTIAQGKKKLKIDCRPSDGMAIAIRMGAEIRVDPGVARKAGMTEKEMLEKGYPFNPRSKFPPGSI